MDDEPAADLDERSAFVICPIGGTDSRERRRADGLFEGIVVPSLQAEGIAPTRADRLEQPGTITTQIVREIVGATVVIADLTGLNANVFYELGIADAFRIPVIRFVDDASTLPFDAKPERTIELPDVDGNIEVRVAQNAVSTLKQFVSAAIADDSPDSVVASAERRASWQVDKGHAASPEREILVEILSRLESAPARGQEITPAETAEVLQRVARTVLEHYVEVLPGPQGSLILDAQGSIDVHAAELIALRFDRAIGGVPITFLHGTSTSPTHAPPAYDMDEEPF